METVKETVTVIVTGIGTDTGIDTDTTAIGRGKGEEILHETEKGGVIGMDQLTEIMFETENGEETDQLAENSVVETDHDPVIGNDDVEIDLNPAKEGGMIKEAARGQLEEIIETVKVESGRQNLILTDRGDWSKCKRMQVLWMTLEQSDWN